jgi:hypothetical protein
MDTPSPSRALSEWCREWPPARVIDNLPSRPRSEWQRLCAFFNLLQDVRGYRGGHAHAYSLRDIASRAGFTEISKREHQAMYRARYEDIPLPEEPP